MDNFAFIIHPIDPKRDVQRKFPVLGKVLPVRMINFLSRFFPPLYISHITGIRSSATGKEIEGWFVACPFTPQRMMTLPARIVYRKIIATAKKAQSLGAQLVGLGAYTSVVGDGGVTIGHMVEIPVTTGDSYTVAIAIEALKKAAKQMEIDLSSATAAVVGATGTIGAVSAELLAQAVPQIILIGRNSDRLGLVKARCEAAGAEVQVATDLNALRQADLVLTVTSAMDSIIEPEHIKSGAVVCDVARPRDVSRQVIEQRDDVLVIEGGMVEVPGEVDFHFNFGFPPRMAYACMAETMVLALDGRYESYSLGKDLTIEQVQEIDRIARYHGFTLGGFRSFENAVSAEQIEQIKLKARSKRLGLKTVAAISAA
ncbi:MAG TPA: shikimate dehydrogenase [Anaerolineae bacterium]|nr:shikimate dehydrogenase [Anaerolineae bacterium]